MWSLFVVADEPVGGHAADLVKGFEHVAVEDLVAVGSIEALDEAFWLGLPCTPQLLDHANAGAGRYS